MHIFTQHTFSTLYYVFKKYDDKKLPIAFLPPHILGAMGAIDLEIEMLVSFIKADYVKFYDIVKQLSQHDMFTDQQEHALRVLVHGQQKYGSYNFIQACTNRDDILRIIQAYFRHRLWYKTSLDDETNLPHIAHALACLHMLAWCTYFILNEQ